LRTSRGFENDGLPKGENQPGVFGKKITYVVLPGNSKCPEPLLEA